MDPLTFGFFAEKRDGEGEREEGERQAGRERDEGERERLQERRGETGWKRERRGREKGCKRERERQARREREEGERERLQERGGETKKVKGQADSLLVAKRPSNMPVYLRDGSAQTILCAATLR